jgi:hypothetical protein
VSKRVWAALAAAALVALSGCAIAPHSPAAGPSTRAGQSDASTGGAHVSTARIQFTTGDTLLEVRLEDNSTSRHLVSQLPLTLSFEDFAGREKISYLPARLATDGSTGSAARNGTLFYYKPWGNIGFFYNAAGGHDDNLIPLGTVENGQDQLGQLENGPVTVQVTG